MHIGDIEKGRSFQAYVHKCSLHSGENSHHSPAINTSHQFTPRFSLYMKFHNNAIFHKGYPCFVIPGIYKEFIGHLIFSVS